ncbi:MAG: DUF1549 domain-containing protein [Akkermansiaceae bacterium]|nr:DUF1549 domain-containing protein [Akkermansiaceae bacterium]
MNFFPKILTVAFLLSGNGSFVQAQSKSPKDEPAFIKQAAYKIDSLVAGWYKQKNLPVPKTTDDSTYARRMFLVSIGRIPTAEEALSFIEIDDPAKREALVEYTLNSKGYSSHMSNWAFDLLRITDQRVNTTATNEPYRHWVRTAMTNNMPWDQFTRSLITSSGNGWDQKTAAVGYYVRDRGMPLDNLGNSMRIFLGTRMECAQCHDDPFGSTARRDFYELAAFTHGQRTDGEEKMSKIWAGVLNDEGISREEFQAAQVMWDKAYGMSLAGGGTGQINLPADYQYRDANPGELVAGRTPFGKTVRMSDDKASGEGRKKLAEWMIERTDNKFSSVIANRMWKRVMGKGIYEPVDEAIPADKTNNPALMTYLTELMIELNYDLRAFQRVLLHTQTFQFATNPLPSTVEGGDDFHGRKIERLSSEQIWDSLITLAAGDPDQKALRPFDDRIHAGGRPVLVGKKGMTQLSKEVLALKSEEEVRAYLVNFTKEIKQTSSASDEGSSSMMGMKAVSFYDKNAKVRASELPSPAPRDHFLYLFGASDRQVIDGFSREPNVGQVLSLMNGFVQSNLVNNPNAHLYQSLKDATSEKEKIRRLYITILNRPPTEQEMSWMLDEVKQSGEGGYRNIVSALVMSSEFLFLQ